MKKIAGLLLLSTITSCHAGFDGITWASRANCLNNESVVWDKTQDWVMGSISEHFRSGKFVHCANSLDDNKRFPCDASDVPVITWRAGAVHWGEGAITDDYKVYGGYTYYDRLDYYNYHYDETANCNLYDGWYVDDPEKDKAEREHTLNAIKNVSPHKAIANEKYKVSLEKIDHSKLMKFEGTTLWNLMMKRQKEYESNGVETRPNRHADYLLNMRDKTLLKYADKSNPHDSHMRRNLSDIILSFIYPETPMINNVIGYAPVGTWNEGWTGFKVFFDKPEFGVCELQTMALADSKMNVVFDNRKAKKLTDGQYYMTRIIGDKTSYEHKITWGGDTYIHELNCASDSLEKSKLDKMLEFAKQYEEEIK